MQLCRIYFLNFLTFITKWCLFQDGCSRQPHKLVIVAVVLLVSFIPFLVFGHFWWQSYENTKKLPNLCLHFATQDGQDGKEKSWQLKWPIYKKPKDKNMGWTKHKTPYCSCQQAVVRDCHLSESKDTQWTDQLILVSFQITPLLRHPHGPQGCLEKQNCPLSLNLVVWCAKIGPKS